MCWSSAECRCHTEGVFLTPDEIAVPTNEPLTVDAIVDAAREPVRVQVPCHSRSLTRRERVLHWIGSRAYFAAERVGDREWAKVGVPSPEWGPRRMFWRRMFSRSPLFPY